MTKVEVPTLTCQRCGHVWTPRKSTVEKCPKCRNRSWAQPRMRCPAPTCGYEWTPRITSGGHPKYCPRCKRALSDTVNMAIAM